MDWSNTYQVAWSTTKQRLPSFQERNKTCRVKSPFQTALTSFFYCLIIRYFPAWSMTFPRQMKWRCLTAYLQFSNQSAERRIVRPFEATETRNKFKSRNKCILKRWNFQLERLDRPTWTSLIYLVCKCGARDQIVVKHCKVLSLMFNHVFLIRYFQFWGFDIECFLIKLT